MSVDETSCDLELIHLSGAVQPPAVMVVLEDGAIEQISENAADLLGQPAVGLIGMSQEDSPSPFPELAAETGRHGPVRFAVRRREGWTYVATTTAGERSSRPSRRAARGAVPPAPALHAGTRWWRRGRRSRR